MKRPCQAESTSDTESDVTIDVGKEEEYSQGPRSVSPTAATSHQIQARKKRRGVIEKRRRDRINSSLSELRRLVPTAFEKQGSSKLEKAEILQMTVDHLKMLHAAGSTGLIDARSLAVDYRTIGFRECLSEVVRYLGILEGQSSTDPVRLRLLSHLNNYVAEMEPPPIAASLLPFQSWPWSLLHRSTAPSTHGHTPRREHGSGLAVLAASSSVVYPSPRVRAVPICRIPTAVMPARRNVLPSRIIPSSQRNQPPVTLLASPSSAFSENLREEAPRSSQFATFLFSSSSLASVPVTPIYVSPPASNSPPQGGGVKTGTARLCRSWTTEIGAF